MNFKIKTKELELDLTLQSSPSVGDVITFNSKDYKVLKISHEEKLITLHSSELKKQKQFTSIKV